ncbi:MAG TPA: DUF222 domain-containing protein [Streptosporangiaceae bacterium]|nr:DUF222 domain-containing protein [Streptosporangiaceae bacterium]
MTVIPWDRERDGPEPEEPSDAELLGIWPDPFAGPPDGADEWLADLSLRELDALAARWAAENGTAVAGPLAAGFRRDGPAEAAVGFAAGGVLDLMAPDPVLAGFAADAHDAGLGRLSDDELVGLLCAARRLSSWQAAIELSAVAELDARRQARAAHPISSRLNEHVNSEIAAALVLTGRSAEETLDLARGLARLPMVLAALAEGRIDRARAAVFVTELAALSDDHARLVAAALCRAAANMTTGQLRAELRALVLIVDPDATRRRRERARAQARVEAWQETSGNSALAGRELPSAEMITADKRLTAIARALKKGGAEGSIDQLRAAVFTALLTGRDPWTLLKSGSAPDSGPAGAGGPAGGLTGAVHLTMPLSAWTGLTEAPGEVAGLGPVDADTCRDLANRLSASPATRWCLTVTSDDGKALGHACARAGPGSAAAVPDAAVPDITAWLASLTIDWLERGTCHHHRQEHRYRPGARLGHLIKIRQRTCAAPGCRRPAEACDLEHTVPYDQGGLTCECGVAPVCRQHHRCKQAPGWHLTQPEPGILTWTAPSGRQYTVEPGRYF